MAIVGHGVDIVEIARIARMLDDHPERFLERCFTESEREYGVGTRRHHEHLAARFAAKEAAMKALGTGLDQGVSWTDIEVVRMSSGEPGLNVTGKAGELAGLKGVVRWWVSLSHTESHAIASVIAESV